MIITSLTRSFLYLPFRSPKNITFISPPLLLPPSDASRTAVDHALTSGSRIGVAPGGIAEMFEGYPKPGTNPDGEYALLHNRTGFVRMAIKHRLPIVGDSIYDYNYSETGGRCIIMDGCASVCSVVNRWSLYNNGRLR